ncbi:MAG: hypothetical protein L6Q71_02295 [Planctomycetes bacterium]|nr:hypothetical protein [Planctomycetota bacterium]
MGRIRSFRLLFVVSCVVVGLCLAVTNVMGGPGEPFPAISIQGRLKTNTGAPLLTNPATITVRIYDDPTGGAPLYSDQHTVDLSGTNGFYSLPVGAGGAPSGNLGEVLRANNQVFFSIEVVGSGGEMGPRIPLLAGAYAVNAAHVEGSRYVKANNSGSNTPAGYSAPSAGDLWYDQSSNELKFFNASTGAWVTPAGGGGFLALTGGTMSGDITFSGSQTFNGTGLMAASVPFSALMSGGAPNDVLTWNGAMWVSMAPGGGGSFLPLTGGMMSGQIDMQTNPIIGLPATPPFGNAATSRDYVDFNFLKLDGTTMMTGQLKGMDGAFNAPSFSFVTNPTAGMYSAGGGALGFSTANTERLQITSTGQLVIPTTGALGLGVVGPNSTLDIYGTFNMRQIAIPGPSVANEGRIYFDDIAKKFKVSEHGGPYVDLAGPWAFSGPDINYLGGRVGVGVVPTLGSLHVEDTMAAGWAIVGRGMGSGLSIGVRGESSSSAGIGVLGDALVNGGIGVLGKSVANNPAFANIAGMFHSDNGTNPGYGVIGLNKIGPGPSVTGLKAGVYGESEFGDSFGGYFVSGANVQVGTGVHGEAVAGSGIKHFGGEFRATGATDNYGVFGMAGGTLSPGLTGTFGVFGQTDNINGYGVLAHHTMAAPITGAALWADTVSTDPNSTIARFSSNGLDRFKVKGDGAVIQDGPWASTPQTRPDVNTNTPPLSRVVLQTSNTIINPPTGGSAIDGQELIVVIDGGASGIGFGANVSGPGGTYDGHDVIHMVFIGAQGKWKVISVQANNP